MDKLIVTVACDCNVSFPAHPHKIPLNDVDNFVDEYVRSVEAGASITHIHGVRHLETEFQPDGRKVSRLDIPGWKTMQEAILSRCDPVMQFGVAAARIEERETLMQMHPDMMSIIFGAHDECFVHDPGGADNEIYATHPRAELLEYARLTKKYGVRPEVECFCTGAFWNIEYVRQRADIGDPTFCTLFFWPGGTWTPPTEAGLKFMLDHLPKDCIWSTSAMDPEAYWGIIENSIALGGHVRVGFEDNPFIERGVPARTNAELVDKAREIGKRHGRELATPAEARELIGL